MVAKTRRVSQGAVEYRSLPVDGNAFLDVPGTCDDWFLSTCDYCGSPTGDRNESPLVLKGNTRAQIAYLHVNGAQARDARLRALPWVLRHGYRTTGVRESVLSSLCESIPDLASVFVRTDRSGVFELRGVDAALPVGRPGHPEDRDVLRCETCRQLTWIPNSSREIGVCLDIPSQTHFVLGVANVRLLFLRANLIAAHFKRRTTESIVAYSVARRDATALASAARRLSLETSPAVALELASRISRKR